MAKTPQRLRTGCSESWLRIFGLRCRERVCATEDPVCTWQTGKIVTGWNYAHPVPPDSIRIRQDCCQKKIVGAACIPTAPVRSPASVPFGLQEMFKSPSRGPRAKQRRGGRYFDPGHLFAACRGADSIFTLFRILPPCAPVSRTRRHEDSNLTLTGMGDRRSW